MTAITPLEFIHKKGIFGNHHKKDQNELLKFSEIKNLSIIQLVQYKKSKINLKEVKIDGLEIPLQNSKVTANSTTRILWNAPRTWLIISNKEDLDKVVKKNCESSDFAITNISHSRAVIQVEGKQTKEILKKGSPINFNEFNINSCAGTVFNGINIIIDFTSNEPDTFNLIVLRSFSESFYHHITDAALEFGYVGI